MNFPLIPKTEADAILEQEFYAQEAYYENLAELGSGAFCEGWSSADANFLAQEAMAEREADFRASEEGERYFARLDAAKLYEQIREARLTDWDIPEFVDGKPSYAHAPYTIKDFVPVLDLTEDIPF